MKEDRPPEWDRLLEVRKDRLKRMLVANSTPRLAVYECLMVVEAFVHHQGSDTTISRKLKDLAKFCGSRK